MEAGEEILEGYIWIGSGAKQTHEVLTISAAGHRLFGECVAPVLLRLSFPRKFLVPPVQSPGLPDPPPV